MPRFALVDASGVVVNIVALERRENFLQRVSHGGGDDASPVWVDTDHHLAMHGAVDLVEITTATGSATAGAVYREGSFGRADDLPSNGIGGAQALAPPSPLLTGPAI